MWGVVEIMGLGVGAGVVGPFQISAEMRRGNEGHKRMNAETSLVINLLLP